MAPTHLDVGTRTETAVFSYSFQSVERCDMCGASPTTFRILGKRLNQSQGLWPKQRTGVTTTVCRCRQCGLVFANPQPTPPTLDAHYAVRPEDYLNYTTLAIEDGHFAEEFAWLERLTPTRPGMRALDVGAGVGLTMAALDRRGVDAYGLEPSQTFYRYATETVGIPAGKLTLASVEAADYPDCHFDFINFGAVLEHLYSPSASLLRALRWLKRGGFIFAEVPSSRWLVTRLGNVFYRLTGSDYVANLSPMHAPYHLYEFTPKSFQLHGEAAGYVVADYRHFVCHTYLPPLISGVASTCMRLTGTGMQLCVWLRKT